MAPVVESGLDKTKVDVVVTDAEEICRAAAVSALTHFGFCRVHEAESGEEVLQQVEELQSVGGSAHGPHGRAFPIVVILPLRMPGFCGLSCAKAIYTLFRERRLPREPFIICASARSISGCTFDEKHFHSSLPKTFDLARLQSVFDRCQTWWERGGGEPGSDAALLNQPGSPRAGQPAQKGITTHSDGSSEQSGYKGSTSDSSSGQSGYKGITILPAAAVYAPPVAAPVAAAQQESYGNTALGGGNSVQSIGSLMPPRSGFEDVVMISLVARGSFGRVYRARWGVSIVALKVVEHFEQDDPAKIAFEGVLSASLAHPNLVQTFKHSIRNAGPSSKGCEVWIVQEWCGLGTLQQKLDSKEILEKGGFNEVIEVCAEIASAASYLNMRGIIHGDLTARNVLLTERRCAKGYVTKVADFGLARVLDNGKSGIDTATIGTVTYMPPELFRLEGSSLTKKVDVYAFGVVMWQLCTNQVPFQGLQPTQVVVMVSQGATLEIPDTVPPALSELCKLSMARDPAVRPDFDEVVRGLVRMADLEASLAGT